MNQWAPWIDDPDDPNVTHMTAEESKHAAWNVARRVFAKDYNPNHEPAGSSKGGQFAPKGSGSSPSMNPDPNQDEDFLFGKYMTSEMARRMKNAIAVAKAMPETYLIEGEQRAKMREDIIDKLYNRNIEERTRNREATIILGLPGAGKSTLANPLLKGGAIEIDPDIAKAEIPEFNGGIGANAVHEESSMITKQVLARAIANGDNIVWPRIDGKDKLERDIKRLQENGYKVHVAIIDVSQETAIKSAVDRFEHTGRLVSPSTIAEYGNTPEETYQTAKNMKDVTVARYKRDHGKGVEPVVDDGIDDEFDYTFLADAGFDPTQERDYHGRWTSSIEGGGEGGGGSTGYNIGPDSLRNIKTGHIKTMEHFKAFLDYYKAQPEILNPDYETLKWPYNRLFKEDREAFNDKIRAHQFGLDEKGVKRNEFLNTLWDTPYETRGIAKYGKMLAKMKTDDPVEQSFLDQAKAFVDKWTPIIGEMNALKDKAVKVTTKRAEAKEVATKALEAKYRDSAPLIKLFESHMGEYLTVAEQRAREHVDRNLRVLEENGWDLNKVAPKPGTYDSDYTVKTERRQMFKQFTDPVSEDRFSHTRTNADPLIVKPSKPKIEQYVKYNVDMAEGAYRGFMQKMTEKIGKPVVKASMSGNIWTNAHLDVETDDGGKQRWHTQMILNFSKYNRMFNQFPSRRKDVQDMNPNHDPKTGEFTFAPGTFNNRYPAKPPGLYRGISSGKTRGGKKSKMEHELWAENWEHAAQLMKERHNAEHPRIDTREINVGTMQYLGREKPKEPPPRPKYPNKGSKEYEFLQEMQKRYDESGYKGD